MSVTDEREGPENKQWRRRPEGPPTIGMGSGEGKAFPG